MAISEESLGGADTLAPHSGLNLLIIHLINLSAIAVSLLYIYNIKFNVLLNFLGITIPAAFFFNIILIFIILSGKNLLDNKRIRYFCYFYLVLNGISVLAMLYINFLINIAYQELSEMEGAYSIINTFLYVFYFGLLASGGLLSWYIFRKKAKLEKKIWMDALINGLLKLGRGLRGLILILFFHVFVIYYRYLKKNDTDKAAFLEKTGLQIKNAVKILLKITIVLTLAVVLITGGFLSNQLLTKYDRLIIEVFLPEFASLVAPLFLGASVLILLLTRRFNNPLFKYGVLAIGLAVYFSMMAPLLLTPKAVLDAGAGFERIYGKIWDNKKKNDIEKYFLNQPFNPAAYYLGIPVKKCIVKKNILYYESRQARNDFRLYFDAYKPADAKETLPGKDSIIVRIHGGGWGAGDKGEGNMVLMNYYLAGLGYTVFDIQYGLSEKSSFKFNYPTPEYVKGNFTIDDMTGQIGRFFKYIDKHSEDYHINLNSVFISGASAGGQLACAAALAAQSGKYKKYFPDNLQIRGIICFYPANGLAKKVNINGSGDLIDPALLLDDKSPPCLIFHGNHDSIVPLDVSKKFLQAYLNTGNTNCLILTMPLAGHTADLYFSSCYNQVFLYYMERFMYIYK